ncbi:MAG TPA: hypothetical protein DEG47_21580 [Cyanobacteria bacterium UBA11148]|nr:hypothetical protein [Cyanobacteria bacterium UBA11148]
MIVTDTTSHKVSSWNRQTYQRLKLALSLGLRRQIFVAICDDLSLRNRLAGKLHNELGTTSTKTPIQSQRLTDGYGLQRIGNEQKTHSPFSSLISLNINLSDPNPLAQITQWLAHNQQFQNSTLAPAFQILGIERLTRQPPTVQRLFLRRLQAIERHLPQLEAALLLWLPRPWFHTIVQSVPEFWQWHTGVFEFEGEPTPLPPVGTAKPEASATVSPSEETTGSFQEDLRSLLTQDLVETPDDLALLKEITANYSDSGNNSEYPLTLQGISAALENGKHENGTRGQGDNNQEKQEESLNLISTSPTESAQEVQEEVKEIPHHITTVSPVEAYLQLGNHYRQIIEQGDASEENLAIAIQAYEQALHWLEDSSPQVSDILNDVGNLYWMLSRCPSSTEHRLSYLEQAIQSYQLALTKLVAENAPQSYAMIQNNLGAAYGDLARHKEPVESLELSIRAYEEALHYRHAESDPIKYASTQNNLGTAYWHLAQHQAPVENLHAAIGAYAESLCYYNSQSEPMNWAMIQNNLGTAYWNLAQYEQPETWLELAVLAYQDALIYRTPDVSPAACAATQNNLGTAYWHLADRFQEQPHQRQEYLHQCIIAYEKAIALSEQLALQNPSIPVNFDVIATRNNLGLAHYQLATEPEFSLDESAQSTHLEAALDQHIKACTSVAGQSDAYQTALSYIIRTMRTFYEKRGVVGQNLALSKLPGQLLPEILPRL